MVFDWFAIPSPLATSFGLADFFHGIHTAAALIVFFGILLHLGGVYKHLAFHQDGTFTKMLVAAKSSGSSGR